MVKRLSAIFAVFFVLTAVLTADQADEKKLLSKVPAGADVVLSVDVTQWLKLPALKKGLSESRDVAVLCRNSQLQPADISAIAFWLKGENMALLAALKKEFQPEKVFAAPRFVCQKSSVSGVVLYNVKSSELPRAAKKRRMKEVAFTVTVLPGNVVAFFSDSIAAVNVLKQMQGKKGYAFPAHMKGSLRGAAKGGNIPPLREAFLSCSMTGVNQGDFSGTLTARVGTAEEAEQLKGQAMLMFNMVLFQYMQKKPELATELLQAFKFDSAGDKVSVKASLSVALLARLGEFAAAQKSDRARKAAERKRKAAERKSKAPENKKSGVSAK